MVKPPRSSNNPNVNDSERDYWVGQVCTFLTSIGVTVERLPEQEEGGFLPRIEVVDGGLRVYAAAFPGDILHEAGHLCTMPSQFRPLANGSLSLAFQAIAKHLKDTPHGLLTFPEDPVCRAALQCSDPEATAWQYAAAQHLGLPDRWLFPPESYDGDAQNVLAQLKARAYFGINGLQAAGWTSLRASTPKPVYPKLAFWVFPF